MPGAFRMLSCLLIAVPLMGCGGDTASGPTTGAPVVVVSAPTPEPVPAPTLTPTPTPTPEPTPMPAPAPTPIRVSFVAAQSFTVVGNRLWTFDKSDNNHALKGGYIRNLSDFSYVGFFGHNISHAAAADYAAKADTMMIGNGGDAGSAAPRIDLFPGFSRYGAGSFLDWYNPETTPRISISLIRFAADGKSVTRSVYSDTTRRTANAVWIDDFRTILVFGVGSTGLTATTLQLGRGAEDFSAAGYGEFIPGKAENEFNGTAKVLGTYVSSIKGTTQDGDWHAGKLYVGLTAQAVSRRTIEVLELALVPGGTLQLVNDYRYDVRKENGTTVRYETQGVTFRNNELLTAAIRDDEYHSIYRFDTTTSATDLKP